MLECVSPLNIGRLVIEEVESAVALEEFSTNTGWSRNDLIASIRAGHGCYTLLVNSELGGYCIVRIVGGELEILNFVVSRKYQGQGMGSYFLKQILECQAYSDVTQNWLEVRAGNLAAQALYHNIGFSIVGKRRGYYSNSGQPEDALIMRRTTNRSGSA